MTRIFSFVEIESVCVFLCKGKLSLSPTNKKEPGFVMMVVDGPDYLVEKLFVGTEENKGHILVTLGPDSPVDLPSLTLSGFEVAIQYGPGVDIKIEKSPLFLKVELPFGSISMS